MLFVVLVIVLVNGFHGRVDVEVLGAHLRWDVLYVLYLSLFLLFQVVSLDGLEGISQPVLRGEQLFVLDRRIAVEHVARLQRRTLEVRIVERLDDLGLLLVQIPELEFNLLLLGLALHPFDVVHLIQAWHHLGYRIVSNSIFLVALIKLLVRILQVILMVLDVLVLP